MTLASIAAKLAAALRLTPCTCKPLNVWPAFASTARVTKCGRCSALDQYDAYTAIVQEPGVKP